MSDDRPNLLPKGIVVNAPDIEQSIERLAGEPVDGADIERMWKVYTTTQRRLLDPTAIRLEQFWWRIWGSQRRELSASTIAAVYAHISHGETFVPLRGPSNRDESGSPTSNITKTGAGYSNAKPSMAQGDIRPSTTSSVSASKIPAVSPLPPILKKPDAPPTSGPRPSVGFASPTNSDAEADDEVEETSSISTNSHVITEPASTDSQISKPDKKGKRKSQPFVASRGGKKRPLMGRRTSSKSAADFKTGLPQSNITSPSLETQPLTETPVKGKGKEKVVTVSKFQENFSVSPEKVLKKPKAPHSTNSKGHSKSKEHRESSRESTFSDNIDPTTIRRIDNTNSNSNGDPGPSTLRNIQTLQTASAEEDLTSAEFEELEMQKVLFKDFERQKRELEQAASRRQSTGSEQQSAGDDLDLKTSPSSRTPKIPRQTAAAEKIETPKLRSGYEGSLPFSETPKIPRDTENDMRANEKAKLRVQPRVAEAQEHIGKASTRSQPLRSKSSTTISQNFDAATGQLDIGLSNASPSSKAHSTDKGKGKAKLDNLFAKRPIPSLPSNASTLSANMPSTMARSKSQLSLLLEKDRVRSGDREKETVRDGKRKGNKE